MKSSRTSRRTSRPTSRLGRRSDAGSASVWLVALLTLGGCVLVAALGLGAAVTARHRAGAAADLAALAAAGKLLWQPEAACAEAARIAGAQHARMLSCALQTDAGEDAVEVSVEVPMAGSLFPGLPSARGRARAGPVYIDSAPGTVLPASSSRSSRIAPALSSGSLPLPHFGDWMQDGQPRSHSQAVMAARVAPSHSPARWKPRSAKPAPPGWPS
jgi:secretion/DNA translocation related TadE-like protein